MTLLVLICGGVGLATFVTGLPILRRPTLSERLAPYLPGARLTRQTPGSVLERVATLLPEPDRELHRRLDAAGLHMSPLSFRTEQIAWGCIALATVSALTIFAATLGSRLDALSAPVLGALTFASGFYARDWWLGKQGRRRLLLLRDELPAAIDMLALSLMAGEGPAASLERVGRFVGGAFGAESKAILAEVRSGQPLVDALQHARDRLDDPAFGRLADALVTGLEKGSPLADVLRAQADDARQARGRELLETAGRKEVLMLIPVVFLIMPVVVVYALFPGLASLDLFVP